MDLAKQTAPAKPDLVEVRLNSFLYRFRRLTWIDESTILNAEEKAEAKRKMRLRGYGCLNKIPEVMEVVWEALGERPFRPVR